MQRWEEAGWEVCSCKLLEGTDSEAAVAHIGVRGPLSLHLGGQWVVGAIGSAPGPRSLPLGPFPGAFGSLTCHQGNWGEPSLPSPSLTLGTLSNCTKVAVVPVLPPHQGGGPLLPVSPSPPLPPPLPSRTISLFPLVFLDNSALYVCVGGWDGFRLQWVWQEFGKGYRKDGG